MSKIEWTDETWNPVVGCSVISPGCTNCYAMRMAARLERMGTAHYAGLTAASKAGPVWTGKVALAPERVLTAPLHWREPRRVFVNSMGDLFHENVPDAAIDRVFAMMALAERHTFQVLTKRSARMRAYFRRQGTARLRRLAALTLWRSGSEATPASPRREVRDRIQEAAYDLAERHHPDPDALLVVESVWFEWPLPNVWLGVSAEDQARADERVPDLLDTPAAVRFVSAEPLLGPIDFTRLCLVAKKPGSLRAGIHLDALRGRFFESGVPYSDSGLDQIIVGGESGPGARPMHPAWARDIRDQCAAAGGAFFFKQWGAWAPCPDFKSAPAVDWTKAAYVFKGGGHRTVYQGLCGTGDRDKGAAEMCQVGKKKAGRLLDGRTWDESPGTGDQGSGIRTAMPEARA